MFNVAVLLAFSILTVGCTQKIGNYIAELHPSLSWQFCAADSICTTNKASVVIDANWRWTHSATGYINCYTDNSTLCPDNRTCAANCALDGAEYSSTYGITNSGNSIRMKFVTRHDFSSNVGSRIYLMASDDTNYQLFKPKNKEFTFDVDVSNLPCGLNGALYFSQMDADGGLSKYPGNRAGARYGTGYCDAKCPHNIKFINGDANVEGWTPSPTDYSAGSGRYGVCCNEMDIWEANSISTAYTSHSCSVDGPYRCSGTECDDGDEQYLVVCDKDGCDFNPYRMGNTSFYGPGKIVDTTKKLTVITQFLTEDGTDTGALKEIRRIYLQGGKIIQNSKVNIPGMNSTLGSITAEFCTQQKISFGDNNQFSAVGGFSPIDKVFTKGVVLVLSVLDDRKTNMLWLDSNYPVDADPTKPGVARGTCDFGSAVPLQDLVPNSSVTFSNIKFGPIGSTYVATGTGTSRITAAGSTPTTIS